MSDNNFGPYWVMDSEDMGVAIMVWLFLLMIPVAAAGDLGLAFAGSLGKDTPLIIYILSWITFVGVYGSFLVFVVSRILLKDLPFFLHVIVYYLQGILLSYAMHSSEHAKATKLIVTILNAIGGVLSSPVG